MAEAPTLAAAFFAMLMYPSPLDLASPANCNADAEVSSASEDAASDAAAQHRAAVC